MISFKKFWKKLFLSFWKATIQENLWSTKALTFRRMKVANRCVQTVDSFCCLFDRYHSEHMYRMNTVIRTHSNHLQYQIHRRQSNYAAHLNLPNNAMILTCREKMKNMLCIRNWFLIEVIFGCIFLRIFGTTFGYWTIDSLKIIITQIVLDFLRVEHRKKFKKIKHETKIRKRWKNGRQFSCLDFLTFLRAALQISD